MKKTIPFTVDQTVHVNKTTSADTKLEENIQKRPPGGKGPRLGEKDDNEVIKGKRQSWRQESCASMSVDRRTRGNMKSGSDLKVCEGNGVSKRRLKTKKRGFRGL